MVKRGEAASDDGVEFLLRREVPEPSLLRQPAALGTGADVSLEQIGKTGDVSFGNSDKE